MDPRLADYVARYGLLVAAKLLGVSRPTLERALGGLKVIPAIQHLIIAGLDADDARRGEDSEGTSKMTKQTDIQWTACNGISGQFRGLAVLASQKSPGLGGAYKALIHDEVVEGFGDEPAWIWTIECPFAHGGTADPLAGGLAGTADDAKRQAQEALTKFFDEFMASSSPSMSGHP